MKNFTNTKHNSSISCTVTECSNHCKEDNYCTLERISIIKNSTTADCPECTDCSNFTMR